MAIQVQLDKDQLINLALCELLHWQSDRRVQHIRDATQILTRVVGAEKRREMQQLVNLITGFVASKN